MNNVEVHYQVKRPDGLFSEVRKFRTAIVTNSYENDPLENREYFKELIAELEKVDTKKVKVSGYKEMR